MSALFMLVVFAGGATDTAPIERMVVLDITAKEGAARLAEELSEVLVSSMRDAAPDTTVIGQSEIKAMLNLEQQRLAVGCEEDMSCLAEIGGALGADHLVSGRLGKIGDIYVLNLKLIHVSRVTVVRHFSRRITGSVEAVLDAVTAGGRHLVTGDQPVAAKPTVTTSATEPLPSDEKEVEEETAWYGQWWIWTVAGGVVVSGVATALALSGGGDDAPPADNTVPASLAVDLNQFAQ